MHPATYRYFGPSDHRLQKVETLALERKNRLQSRYRLVVTQGKDGEKLAEYPLVIDPGRGKVTVPITGKMSQLEGGGVVLDYNIPSKEFAGMSFFGSAGGERQDAWAQKEITDNSNEFCIVKPTFSVRSFVCMSFDEQGQCIIKDFKYTIHRSKFIEKSNYSAKYKMWFKYSCRETWVTMKLQFDPVVVQDSNNISGDYTCTANGDTWIVETIEGAMRSKNKEHLNNTRSKGTWTLTKKEGNWHLEIHPGQAPIPEMMAPIEVVFEEDWR